MADNNVYDHIPSTDSPCNVQSIRRLYDVHSRALVQG